MSVKTLCLGALSFEEATGYDIKKLFEAAFSHIHNASFGSIYPALRQLEAEGLVDCRVEAGDGRPDRKLFRLTEQGHEALVEALSELPAGESHRSDFLTLMFFAHLLPTEVLAAKLAQIETFYQGELAHLEAASKSCAHTPGIAYTIEHGIRVYRAKLDVLRERRDELLRTHRRPPPA